MRTTPITIDDLDQLKASTRGRVFHPGEPAAAAALAGQNTAPQHEPVAVVQAAGVEDVAAAVRWAAARGLPVDIQATGHGGCTFRGSVVITTRLMSAVTVDPERRTARVSAGTTWGAVIEAAAPFGLAPLSGSSPTVGVVGYTLGGGTGLMARKYGFASDHVRNFEIVTADGRVRFVDPTHEPDLYWAVRGAKGNFGVVTALEFDLMPVEGLHGGAVYFAGRDARVVLHRYATWAPTLPDASTTSIALLRLPDVPGVPEPLRGTLSVHLRWAHLGGSDEGDALLAPMRAAAPALLDLIAAMPYSDTLSIFNDPIGPMPSWSTGVFLDSLPAAAVNALLAAAGPGADVPLVMVELRHLGGALSRLPLNPNSVGGRDAAFALGVVGPLPAPLRDIVPAVAAEVVGALGQWQVATRPINYLHENASTERIGRAWSAEDLDRLLRIKQRHDPQNTFRTGYALTPRRVTDAA